MKDIEEIHAEACYAEQDTYVDPVTGYSVFTSLAHKRRGVCCGSGCRHCPFSHERCQPNGGQRVFEKPRYISNACIGNDRRPPTVVFFSGGKDSFLSLALTMRDTSDVVLLSTYDPAMNMNGIQQVPMNAIESFAAKYYIDLIAVPISSTSLPYPDMVHMGLQLVPTGKVEALVFGDIHLEHIRKWREHEFSSRLGYSCKFPLWNQDYSVVVRLLADACEQFEVSFVFSAIYDEDLREKLSLGMPYNEIAIEAIAECGKDVLGENGEFHTCVQLVDRDHACDKRM